MPADDPNITRTAGNNQLPTFRIISCSTLIGLVSVAVFIFSICRMHTFRDCMAQICFEVSLVLAHVLLLVDANSSREPGGCTAMAISIHYFFTAAFLFLALECLCQLKTMTKFIPLEVLNRSWHMFVIGWGIPIIIVIVSAATVSGEYIVKDKRDHCWLNLQGNALLATVIPIGIFAALAFVFLCLAICFRPDENYEVDEESYIRYEAMQDIRWMLLLILTLMIAHWSVGMIATHQGNGHFFIAFIVLTIVLGIIILMLRCIGDDEVRLRIRTCSHGSSIEPSESDLGKYFSKDQAKSRKGVSFGPGPGTEGMLIIKRTYIFRP